MTKLYNRQHFDELFLAEAQRAKRYNHELSIVLFDIDDFKHINDTYGHERGDAVLQELSKLIREHLRESDIVARWGGEEFIILMVHTNLQQAIEKAEQLRAVIEKHSFELIGNLSCSLGVAHVVDLEHPQRAFGIVDKALYRAKENGKNRVYTYA